MTRRRISTILLAGIVALVLSSCGSEGPGGGAGGGNTVLISAMTQNGEATTAVSSVGTPPFTLNIGADTLKFTITSTPYTSATGTPSSIPASSVNITREHVSFIPQPDSNGALSPALPSFDQTSTGTVTPGGTLNMELIIVGVGTKQYIYNNALLTTSVQQLSYSVAIDFIGEEINTGTSVSCRAYANALISQ